jgi:hypothetical protein
MRSRITALGWSLILTALAAVLIWTLVSFLRAESALYLVTSTREAAQTSLLNCGNVSFPTKGQAERYAAQRPVTHVFRVGIRQVK